MNSPVPRSITLSCAYEHALRSAYAQGSMFARFSPESLLEQNGAFIASSPIPEGFIIPEAFSDDTETIHEAHASTLEKIARQENLSTKALDAFAQASYLFHGALLLATDSLLRIDQPLEVQALITVHVPNLFTHAHSLTLTARRYLSPQLTEVIEQGSLSQLRTFLTYGSELSPEPDFFLAQLNKLSEKHLTYPCKNAIILA